MRSTALYLMLALAGLPAVSAAGELSLGLGYPYVSAKYDLGSFAGEARVATGGGVSVYAGRGYWNFHRAGQLTGFAGLEAGYISFNTLQMKGSGAELALFAGGQYSVSENFAVLLDFAPTLIALEHQTYDVGVSGLEYVVNLGFYYRFGAKPTKGAYRPSYAAPRPAAAVPKPAAVPPAEKPAAVPRPAQPQQAPQAARPQKPAPAPKPAAPLPPDKLDDAKFAMQDLDYPDWRIRRRAALTLGILKYGPAVTPLIGLLKDENSKVRGMAALSLGNIADAQAVTPLLGALEDADPYVRASAAEALGAFGDAAAVPGLTRALRDGDPAVSKAARDSLVRIERSN